MLFYLYNKIMDKATNNLIKELKRIKKEGSLLFLDNIKIINDAISHGLKPKYILVEREELNIYNCDNVYKVDKTTIDQLSDSKTPQGVVCVAEYLQHTVQKPKDNFLVVDGLQDPGNVGTLIRTAYACGFNEVFLIDSVKVTNSKLVRSSVGAIFLAKVYEMSRSEFVNFAKKNKLCLLKADMDGENIFTSLTLGDCLTNSAENSNCNQSTLKNNPIGVVIGNEGQGVSEEISKICSLSVKIPMQEGIESLNASVSGAIIMYEINKKRLS